MRATVVGLERFCAMMWKGLQCDECGRNYTGTIMKSNGDEIRRYAVRDGWFCNKALDTDLCPNCAQRSNVSPPRRRLPEDKRWRLQALLDGYRPPDDAGGN